MARVRVRHCDCSACIEYDGRRFFVGLIGSVAATVAVAALLWWLL